MQSAHFEVYKILHAHGFAWGEREQDTLIRLSGDAAAQHWRAFATLADNVSRLDLQCTASFSEPLPHVRALSEELAKHHPRKRGKPPKITTTYDSQGGNTLYLGSRSSAFFCRLYDKGVQKATDAPGVRWRWEVEIKRKAALPAAQRLAARAKERPAVASAVAAEFDRHGIPVPWTSSCTFVAERAAQESDWQRTLDWLYSGVAPTIRRARDEGYFPQVLHALGLGDDFEARITRLALRKGA